MKKRETLNAFDENGTLTTLPLTSFVVEGLGRLEWEMERIRLMLEAEQVRIEDRKTITRSFSKVERECALLRNWLSLAPLEEMRN
jgi:hypothetical protein